MQKLLTLIAAFVLLAFAGCSGGASGEPSENPSQEEVSLKVVSYNLLFDRPASDAPAYKLWENRLPNVLADFSSNAFDIIGTQELLSRQVADILAEGTYARIGKDVQGKNGTNTENEAVFYRKERFEVVREGQFWYSATPDKAGTTFGIHTRCCTWGQFREKASGRTFYVFNSHLHANASSQTWPSGLPFTDEEAAEVRLKSARLLLQRVSSIASYGEPVFLTGDFNCRPDSDPIKLILADGRFADSRSRTSQPLGPEGTFTGFSTSVPSSRIDFVFVNSFVQVNSYEVLDSQQKTQKWESDHLPVCVNAVLK